MQQLRGGHLACFDPQNPGEFMFFREHVERVLRIDKQPTDFLIIRQQISYPDSEIGIHQEASVSRTSISVNGLTLAEQPNSEADLPYGMLRAFKSGTPLSTPGVSLGVEMCASWGGQPIKSKPNNFGGWYRPLRGGAQMLLVQAGHATYADPRVPMPRSGLSAWPNVSQIRDLNVQLRLAPAITLSGFAVEQSDTAPIASREMLPASLPHPVPDFELGIPPTKFAKRYTTGATIRFEGQRWNATLKSWGDAAVVGMSGAVALCDGRVCSGLEVLLPPADPVTGMSLSAGAVTTLQGMKELGLEMLRSIKSLFDPSVIMTPYQKATSAFDTNQVILSGTVNTNGTVSGAASVPVSSRFTTVAQLDYSLISRESTVQLGVLLEQISVGDILRALVPSSWSLPAWMDRASHSLALKYTPDRGSAIKLISASNRLNDISTRLNVDEQRQSSWVDNLPWRFEFGISWPKIPDVKFSSSISPMPGITENLTRAPVAAAAPIEGERSSGGWITKWHNPFSSLGVSLTPRFTIGLSFGDMD